MMNGVGAHFPPYRLRAVNDRWHAWLRPAWFVVLVFALVLDVAGTVYVVRDAFVSDPAFQRLGLNSRVENDGSIGVYGSRRLAAPPLPEGSYVVSIDGAPVAHDTRVWELARRLERPDGARVKLGLVLPDGKRVDRVFTATPELVRETGPSSVIPRNTRTGIRLALALAACLTLIACAVLLFMRRPRDPVALLFSFSFLIFAAVIDPPLNLWLATGFGFYYDL
jgi:hypothetical protein